MSEIEKKDWFASWFDSPYYHLLYRNRNDAEAQMFIDHLLTQLQIPAGATALDLACGKGRHSIYLNQQGLHVTGVDLSPQSIAHANQSANPHLSFFVHDMRKVFKPNAFQYIFNLFTSFGYFDHTNDNLEVMHAIEQGLTTNGTLVLDFMNAQKAINTLVPKEEKVVGNITFRIQRKVVNNCIVKQIDFTDNGKDYQFEERVQALQLKDFQKLINATELQIIHTFGSYRLEPFHSETSDRLILIAKKQ